MATTSQNIRKANWVRGGGFYFVEDLLQVGADAKTVLGEKIGVLTGIMYLSPAKQNFDGVNLCPMADLAGCEKPCLFTAGRGGMSDVEMARRSKTHFFLAERALFMETLAANIERLIRKASRQGKELAIRLNGTSDILWERIPVRGKANIMEAFPNVQFYDYTKRPGRVVPDNYHLTFSYSEVNPRYAEIAMKERHRGLNIAVVFRNDDDPETINEFRGIPVFDATKTDCRFADGVSGQVAGLCAKGTAKVDTSGFVVN